MTDYIQQYLNLLIFQYQDKPKLKAEITALLEQHESTYNYLSTVESEFDLDTARGVQLDVIGRIVGLSRTVPLAVSKKYFGFEEDDNAFPFDELFDDIVAYPFKEVDEEDYTDLQLNDADYRFFLRAKIAKNFARSDITSINEIVGYLFEDLAEVIDKYDMTLDLYIDATIDISTIRTIQQLDLLPKPQGVRYNNIVYQFYEGDTFGFSDDLSAFGFDDLFETVEGGKFAEVIFE